MFVLWNKAKQENMFEKALSLSGDRPGPHINRTNMEKIAQQDLWVQNGHLVQQNYARVPEEIMITVISPATGYSAPEAALSLAKNSHEQS